MASLPSRVWYWNRLCEDKPCPLCELEEALGGVYVVLVDDRTIEWPVFLSPHGGEPYMFPISKETAPMTIMLESGRAFKVQYVGGWAYASYVAWEIEDSLDR